MRTSRLLFAVTVLALPVSLGCERRHEPTPTSAVPLTSAEPGATPPASARPAAASSLQTPTVAARMAEHFTSSAAMRSSLVKGDLAAFHAAAANLADKELSANLSDTWKPHLDAMRAAARRAKEAKSTETGARALADVGRACAGCHSKLGGPKLEVGSPPAPASGAKPHMARHDWAADRMWEGLMAPSQESWSRGAAIFAEAPLGLLALTGPKSVSADVDELARHAHVIGQQARAATDTDARTRAVGDLYATCAGCHAKLSVTIK